MSKPLKIRFRSPASPDQPTPAQQAGKSNSNKDDEKKKRSANSGAATSKSTGRGGGGAGSSKSSSPRGNIPRGTVAPQKRKLLLHEIAAKKYQKFLALQAERGDTHWAPLNHYMRPKGKRKRLDGEVVTMRVPKQGPLEGSHVHMFSPEYRKAMTVDPEQIAAFLKPGGGVIELTGEPPLELKTNGLLGQDLNEGYLTYTEPDTTSSTEEITNILDKAGLEREEEAAHFITYRNNMNKILATPYGKQKWEMEVFKEDGMIYLEVVSLDRNNRAKMDRTSYWGRRFETLCVLGVEGTGHDDRQRVPGDPARPSYCALYRSRLGGHNIVMGAEIDAHLPSESGRFVEIKTTKLIRDAKDEQIFKKHKCLKYWAQCYLAGVKELVVGYRDDGGIVRDVKHWTTDALVESVDRVKHWDKDVCLNFADRFLSFLKDNVDEGVRYVCKHLDPWDTVTLQEKTEPMAGSDGAGVSAATTAAAAAAVGNGGSTHGLGGGSVHGLGGGSVHGLGVM